MLRELSTTAVSLFLVLLAITLTNLLLRLLGRAAGGTVATEGIVALIGFNALYYLPILLSVTVFLAVLLTLTRSYRDSEMIVWFTSGQGLTAWIRPILTFALPIVAMIGLASLWLSPWAEQRKQQYEQQLEARDEFAVLSPGLFKEFRRADLVVFVESINTFDGSIRNVFAQSNERGKEVTLVARSGILEDAPNGDRFIVLNDGRRYEGVPGTTEFRVLEFERLARRIEPNEIRSVPPSIKAQPTHTLLEQAAPAQLAEFFWRMGVPLSALLLVCLAIPLSHVNPRMGRSFNLIAAVLLYMIYNNCLSIVQSWIAQGRLVLVAGVIAVHGTAALLVVLAFYRRLAIITLRRIR